MLSRIADSMYWMNRYIERSEGMLRMLHTNYVLSLDKGETDDRGWRPFLRIFTGLPDARIHALANQTNEVFRITMLDASNPNSLKSILNKARENARGMQDHVTKELWEQVNHLYHEVNREETSRRLLSGERLATMESLLKDCLLYTGITDSTMPRGMGWDFMSLGKFVERCDLTLSLTAAYFQDLDRNRQRARDILYWRSLLFTLSGYEFHLKHYRSTETDRNVMDQALFNGAFPHSAVYSLSRARDYFNDVLEANRPEETQELSRLFGRLYSHVEFADRSRLQGGILMQFLMDAQSQLMHFNSRFSETFFYSKA